MYKAYSAPGKALLAGGFLVLDPEYPSYVTALSSRMHACIKQGESSSFSSIKIDSPQFNGEWEYHFSENFDTVKDIEDRRNPFIEATIKTLLAYLSPTERFNIQITIFSDPGYHAQDNTVNKRNFLFHGKPIENVAKTGLGSSAGLVSVLTTAIIMFFQPNLSLNDVKTKNIIHNAAQIAHCFAQKRLDWGLMLQLQFLGQ